MKKKFVIIIKQYKNKYKYALETIRLIETNRSLFIGRLDLLNYTTIVQESKFSYH